MPAANAAPKNRRNRHQGPKYSSPGETQRAEEERRRGWCFFCILFVFFAFYGFSGGVY